MTLEEVKSAVLKKVGETGSVAVLMKLDKFIDNTDISKVTEISRTFRERIKASREDIKSGKFIENKLLRKEVRIWLKNR